MFQYIQYFQVYDQGLFNYYNVYGSKNLACGNTEEDHPYLEASGIMATAVNEMLLQSYGSVIRVFPAVPQRWPARFVLRAEGSFLVASEHRGSQGVAYVAVQPLGGGPRVCRVVIPWTGGARLTCNGQPSKSENLNGVAVFTAEPGRVYVLSREDKPLDGMPLVNVTFETQYSPCRVGNVWFGNSDGPNNHTSTFPLW